MEQYQITSLAALAGALVSGMIAAYAKYALRNRKLNIIATIAAVVFTVILMVIVWRSFP